MRHPYCILNVSGDVLGDGELSFIGATRTLKAARRCVKALGQTRPGEFVIYNQQTGETLPIKGETERVVGGWLSPGRNFFKRYTARG